MNETGPAVQSVFTVVAAVRADRVADLSAVLDKVAQDPSGNDLLPLGRLAGLHYASLVLFAPRPNRSGGPLLVFECNVDGSIDEHLDRLLDVAAPGLDHVWSACTGYPARPAGRDEVRRWLRSRVVRPGAYHVGATGRSRAQIEAEATLRGEIESFLDTAQSNGSLPETPRAIRDAVRAHVRDRADLAWALDAPPPARAAHRAALALHLAKSSDRRLLAPAGLAVAALTLLTRRSALTALAALTAAGAAATRWLTWRETTDTAEDHPVPDDVIEAIEQVEDRSDRVTNHLASLVDLKPGWGRRTLLRAVLLVIDVAARTRYTKGELGGIPSIHFAHWSIIDRGRRLLFVSNYDGSWESYLDDFIEKAASGLTAVWSNTRNFPRCRWLGLRRDGGGARRGPAFKRVARNSQVATTIHFAAYPRLTVANIQRNTAIRGGLAGELDEQGAQAWLSQL